MNYGVLNLGTKIGPFCKIFSILKYPRNFKFPEYKGIFPTKNLPQKLNTRIKSLDSNWVSTHIFNEKAIFDN